MDTRLLRHYENELLFLREMGAEFAEAYPKIAARLGMEGMDVADPYVERLLEGVAFLSARVHLELDLQFPAFTSHLLEIVYPHYLTPTPSMMVATFDPDMTDGSLKDGHVIPRHTEIRTKSAGTGHAPVIFRTANDVTLWPVTIEEAEYIEGRGALVAAGVAGNDRAQDAKAAIRLRLKRYGDQSIAELPLERLSVFVPSAGGQNWRLHETLSTRVVGLAARSTDRRDDWVSALPDGEVRPVGFSPDEALLPTPRRAFDGYRLLQEYFAMPERFHFVELSGLAPAFWKAKGADVDLYILLSESNSDLAPGVSPEAFDLNAVPCVNLFAKRCDRVQVSQSVVEHHVVPDRTAGMDYEVHSITSVTGVGADRDEDLEFRPFYSADDFTAAGESYPAYYTIHRRMRERSEKERLKGVRTSYLGSEVYLTLVDSSQAPHSPDLEQLSVRAMCTNRDLPLLLASGGDNVFHLPDGGPVKRIRTPVAPKRPKPSLTRDDTSWRLISHLSLNYLSIADSEPEKGGAALRELVGIYAPLGDKVIERQLEGIQQVSTRPIVRRMSDDVLSTAVRGLEITMRFDESSFEGSSVYLLGAVLERFFRKYVTINSFTETVLTTHQRGEIARWRPTKGLGRII